MKTLLFLLSSLLFLSCSNTERPENKSAGCCAEPDRTGAFYINKNKTTYEIYTNKGELILEFTPQNTDSNSLKTLDYIFETVKEFYNVEAVKEKQNKIDRKSI